MDRGGEWRVVTGWRAVLVSIIALPFILLFHLLIRPFLPRDWDKTDRTPGEVAGYIQDFLDGTGGEWDWDDFTSVPIKHPELDIIRTSAEMVPLPLDEAGRATLRELHARAQALAAPYPS